LALASVALPGQCSILDDDLSSTVILSESRGNSIFHSLSTSSHSMDEVCFPHDLTFGDYISSLKDEHVFWVSYCNIGGFPVMSNPNDKAQEIKHFMATYDLDLFGRCKANLNWSKTLDTMKLHKWFCDVPSSHTFLAHNVTEQSGLRQFGGTFWIGTGMATQYIAGSCKDPLGLGWWVVCTLSSCSGCKVHLIFGY